MSRGLYLFGFVLVVEFLVVPQMAGARRALQLITHLNLLLALLGAVLEVVAVLSYAQLTRVVLPPPGLGLATTARVDLATLAVSHLLPGGNASAAGLGYRLFTSYGIDGTDVGFALGTQGLGSAVVLNVILWLSLLISIPLDGFQPLYWAAALVGILLGLALAVLIFTLTKGEERARRVLDHLERRLPFLQPGQLTRILSNLARRLAELAGNPYLLRRAIGWAAANWLLDAASLWVFLAAFHQYTPIYDLMVAYGLANVAGAIPISPGGLGVIEGVLIPSLVGFGASRGAAILGVISWRLFNFWVPIPVGGFAYLSLRQDRSSGRRKERLAEMTDGIPVRPFRLPTRRRSKDPGRRPDPNGSDFWGPDTKGPEPQLRQRSPETGRSGDLPPDGGGPSPSPGP